MFEKLDPNDAESLKRMRTFFSPQQVDQQIRMAIQFCWMALPPDKKSVDEVEIQLRRIFERAIRDLREDATSFDLGMGGSGPETPPAPPP